MANIIMDLLMEVRMRACENNQAYICYRQNQYHLFWLVSSSRRINLGKDNDLII